MRIPKSLHHYFWDVDVKKIDARNKPYFIINRLLDKGDIEAVKWVRKNYSENEIKDTFTHIRDFNPKVGRFWALFLQIPEDKVVCIQPSYLKMRRQHWPY